LVAREKDLSFLSCCPHSMRRVLEGIDWEEKKKKKPWGKATSAGKPGGEGVFHPVAQEGKLRGQFPSKTGT